MPSMWKLSASFTVIGFIVSFAGCSWITPAVRSYVLIVASPFTSAITVWPFLAVCLLMHHNHVTGGNAIIAHGRPLHPQGKRVASPEHRLGYLDTFRLGDGLDGIAGGDDARQR